MGLFQIGALRIVALNMVERIYSVRKKYVALITGSSQGLGFEVAKILDKNSMRIILTGRELEKLDNARNQLSSKKNILQYKVI